MKKTTMMLLSLLALTSMTWAHCQIPCGIYGDAARFTEMEEHVVTIEKSMKKIMEISVEDKPDYNQLVRWVDNKEVHAAKLNEIVTYYFLAQRIKPKEEGDGAAYEKYVWELKLLHGMMVHIMKAKQTTDLEHVEKLRALIGAFKVSYLPK